MPNAQLDYEMDENCHEEDTKMLDLPLNVDFSGKVVVVTGAGGVLCGTMVKAFAQAGAKVAALDLNEEAVKALADECKAEGFLCEGYKANVLEPEALEAVHQQVLKDLGPCDILVNGAGGNNPRATTDNEYQHEWTKGQKGFFDLDAGGVFFLCDDKAASAITGVVLPIDAGFAAYSGV